MKINSLSSQTFKGYDAVPLKNLYMLNNTPEGQKEIFDELRSIAKKEGFGLYLEQENELLDKITPETPMVSKYKWAQDNKIIMENEGEREVLIPESRGVRYANLGNILSIPTTKVKSVFEGGNVYIGKKDNGERYLIVGENVVNDTSLRVNGNPEIPLEALKTMSKRFARTGLETMLLEVTTGAQSSELSLNFNNEAGLEQIAKDFNVKKENICVLPQVDFHIDMFVRPIGFPYILVNDINLSDEIYARVVGETIEEDEPDMFKAPDKTEEVIKKLEQFGFVPIRVGGVFGERGCVNFLNAVVNKHEDGTISYITCSSRNAKDNYDKLEKEFDKQLYEKIPNLRKVYHIGSKEHNNKYLNIIMADLFYRQGGVHCLVCEEPNFDKWV